MALDVLSREVERMGPGWALLPVNHSFNAIPTYPPSLPLPSTLASVLLPPSSPQFPFPRSTHPSTPSIPPTPSPSLGNLASFRSRSRVPSLSWAAPGRAILRSSQPLVGMLGARCFEDEKLITEAVRVATASALAIDRRRHTVDFSELDDGWAGVGLVANSPPRSGFQMPPSSDYVPFCIMDLRSYTAALGQMGVTGGGYENAENYPTRGTPVLFLSLGNIHAVSTAHAALLKGLASKDVEGWYGRVESSGWHGLVAEVLRASWEVADRVGSGAVTLVHCTDGWDRTSQVVALAQIILDPFYRTMEGLKTLIQKEFITYGHPFRARHPTPTITLYNQSTSPPLQPLFSTQFQSAEPPPGRRSSPVVSSQPSRERTSAQIAPEYVPPPHSPSPIFLLFLTCVRHLILEHSTRFEYHTGLLLVLARAVSGDGPFGDFLFNNMLERQIIGAGERTGSVWRWIDDRSWLFHNTHYDPVEADLARGTKAGWFPNGVQWSDEMALHFPSVDQNPVGLWDDLYLEDLQPIVRLFSLPPSAALLLPPYARELLSKRNIEIAQGLHRLAAARARRTARSMLTSWRTHVLSRRKSAWEANVIGRWAAEHIVSVAVARVGELDRNKPRGLEEFALHVSPKSVGMGLRATRVRRKVGADGKVKEVELGIEEDGPPRLRRSLVDEHPLESSQGQGAPANSSAENGWVTMGREAAPDVEIVFFLEEADWRDIEYSPAANPASAIERQMSDAMRDIL
ncbi:phosphatases II [Gonapodya prolifera JEL478]|uniref:Phosphatases II n=1 Tax=Gonapodya prolifera (strain JEL478) TaxID=1344416 RepID=A0A139A8V7_GONPJ|nr:phosphatases II [Gonapodya prolifera JEL478]|eukprot:KXS13242.1 phosphatases II [Gonapodya prolifera JEL478]